MNLFKVSRAGLAGSVLAAGLLTFASIAFASEAFNTLFETEAALQELSEPQPVEARLVSATRGASKEELLALAEQTYIDDIAACEQRHPEDKKLCDACIQVAEAKHRFTSHRIEQDLAIGPNLVPEPMPEVGEIIGQDTTCEEIHQEEVEACDGDEMCEYLASMNYYDCRYCIDCRCCTESSRNSNR